MGKAGTTALDVEDVPTAAVYYWLAKELTEPSENYSRRLVAAAAHIPDAVDAVAAELFATAEDTGDLLVFALARELGSAAWASQEVQRRFAAGLAEL